jgi:chromosome segregation protein
MNKIGNLIGIKPGAGTAAEKLASPMGPEMPEKNIIELDNELFLPMATQTGEDNESVRNLLIDAEHKIRELDAVKRSVSRLVDPINKTLRALEEANSEKIGLQAALNNIRITNNKLRGELDTAERKVATLDSDCTRLREHVTVTQQKLGSIETTRAEQANELATRRSQVTDLQRRLQQQGAELQGAREENRRLSERMTLTDKRAVQLESETAALQQKFLITDKERTTLQASLEKAYAELSHVSQRLLDTDKALASTQMRMQKAEAALSEAQAERHRLAATLDDINQKHQNEISAHRTNFETLQARAAMTEKLLDEARQSLVERAEEIRTFDRRLADSSRMHATIGEKLGLIEEALAERNARIKELDQARAALAEKNDMLSKAVSTRENAYNRAQEHIVSLEERIQLLESEVKATRQTNETEIELLNARLQREQIARTMAEGAVEAGRKDIARLLQELATLQYDRASQTLIAEGSAEPSAPAESPAPLTRGSTSAQAA